ncbi:MAG: DUF5615 family PIN-like protein [bacterium]
MKILLDTCVWGGARDVLLAAGHDVSWAGDWPHDPGDTEILQRAKADSRILVTLDKDFGELAIVRNIPHCGILRLVNFSALQQGPACMSVLSVHGEDLVKGAVITASPGRMRYRPPDDL